MQLSDVSDQYSESVVNCDKSISEGKFSAPQITLINCSEIKEIYYESGKYPEGTSKTTDFVYNEDRVASGNGAVKN